MYTPAFEMFTDFGFSTPIVFELGARTERTGIQTDGRTDGQDPCCGLLEIMSTEKGKTWQEL